MMMKISIEYEDTECLVVNKPRHLRTISNKEPSLLHWAGSTYGCDVPRNGIVHRLDKGTCGLLIIAKSLAFFNHITDQFRKRLVKKTYACLVHGSVQRMGGMINTRIKQNNKYLRSYICIRGKEALTYYRVERKAGDYSQLTVKIVSGRMHQIRIHLFSIGHPIVGDQKYCKDIYRDQNSLLLQAYDLKFKSLDGRSIHVVIPIDHYIQLLKPDNN